MRTLAHFGTHFTHRVLGLSAGVTKGPRNQKKKGVLIKTGEEASTAGQERENSENPMGANTFTRAGNEEQDEGSPMDFSFPLASSPPRQDRTFREQGESSRGQLRIRQSWNCSSPYKERWKKESKGGMFNSSFEITRTKLS